ncbi:hypothetical protein [Xanthobacter autotrophicus]|uniref:hypothetical protein n=1 Tax=Xanthobacter autotrophicus TaxID=280 RepID=UPI0037278635
MIVRPRPGLLRLFFILRGSVAASEPEEPFGTLPNDLPIAALATSIEIILREGTGEGDLPEAPVPEAYLLL